MTRGNRGYTLTEIVVSIAAVCLIAAAMTPLVVKQIDRSRLSSADRELGELRDAFTRYQQDTRVWPCLWNPASSEDFHSDLQSFSCLYENNGLEGWNGPYLALSAGKVDGRTFMALKDDQAWRGFIDPWGRPFRAYFASARTSQTPEGVIVVYSLGKNGRIESDDQGLLNLQTGGDDLVLAVIEPGPR